MTLALPLYRATGSRSQSSGAASIAPSRPTVDGGAYGLFICVVQSKNNAVHSCATSGWSKLDQQNSGASFTASIFYAAEGAAAPTITWTGSAACAAQIFYYSDPQNTIDPTPVTFSASTGNTSTHTSSAINTTRDNSLVIYVDASAANTALATPSGWAENVDGGSGTDAGETTAGSKPVATSGTSSGAISVTGANAAWVQWQIEILSGAPSAGLQSSQMETGAIYTPGTGLYTGQLQTGVLYTPPGGLDSGAIETFILAMPGGWVPRIIRYKVAA